MIDGRYQEPSPPSGLSKAYTLSRRMRAEGAARVACLGEGDRCVVYITAPEHVFERLREKYEAEIGLEFRRTDRKTLEDDPLEPE